MSWSLFSSILHLFWLFWLGFVVWVLFCSMSGLAGFFVLLTNKFGGKTWGHEDWSEDRDMGEMDCQTRQSQINRKGSQMHLILYNASQNWHFFALRILKQFFSSHLFCAFIPLPPCFLFKPKTFFKLVASSKLRLDMRAGMCILRRQNRTWSLKIIFLFW